MTERPVYLDNNATTRPDPRVVEAMLPFLGEIYGNAASHGHSFGWAAEEAVERARHQVAGLIGAEPPEIVFTSGATEADNLALKGVAEAYAPGDHLITCVTEHKAVLDSARHLERLGRRVTYLGVDAAGRLSLDELQAAFTEQTVLVSVMFANNETGTLQDVAEIGSRCRQHGILFHTDATQGAGKIPVNVNALNIDLMSFTAHKMHGPKGVGALYVRRKNPRVRLTAQMDGGGHERGNRSGTLNVPGIVGFGEAAALAASEMTEDAERIRRFRDALHLGLCEAIPGLALNGHPTERLPNTLNVAFQGVNSDALLAGLSDIAVSSGSACSSASIAPSHVLKAMGLSDGSARSSLRFSLSRFTSEEEISHAVAKVTQAYERIRQLSLV